MSVDNPYQLDMPEDVSLQIAESLRKLRLTRKWKQSTLSERAGVTLASLRRFEQTGEISLKNLLRLSFALGRLGDFKLLFQQPDAGSIQELEMKSKKSKIKRGRE